MIVEDTPLRIFHLLVSCSYQGAPYYPQPLGSCLVRSSCTRPWDLGFSCLSSQDLTKHLAPVVGRGERASPNTDPRDYVGPVATGVSYRRVSGLCAREFIGIFVCVCTWISSSFPFHRFPLDPRGIRERSGHPKGLPLNKFCLVSCFKIGVPSF